MDTITGPVTFLPDADQCWSAFPETLADLDTVLAFDTETTGVDFDADRIVTAHLSRVRRGTAGAPEEAYDVLIDAGVEISEGAEKVHGVSNERRIAEGVPEHGAVTQIANIVRYAIDAGVPLVAFNGAFDFTMLARAIDRHRLGRLPLERAVILDPFVLDKALDKFRRGKRQLTHVAAHYQVPFDNAHDASADAVGAAHVLFAIIDRFQLQLPLSSISQRLQEAFRVQATGLEDYFRRQGRIEAPLNKHWPIAAPADGTGV
ncbi:MAG: exonuclease domain-containing protein [Microbacteriaceae bacterium]